MSETKHGKLFIFCKDPKTRNKALFESVEHLVKSVDWELTASTQDADALLVVLEPHPAAAIKGIWELVVKDIQAHIDKNNGGHYDHLIFYSPTPCGIAAGCTCMDGNVPKWHMFLAESCPSLNACHKSLPKVLSEISERIKSVQDAGRPSYVSRLGAIARHAGEPVDASRPRYSWGANAELLMTMLADKAGDRESRLDQEHDTAAATKSGEDRRKLVEEQAAIDYYYLAVSSAANKTKRTIVCIDDQPSQFDHFLALWTTVTGDLIYYTEDDQSARTCIASMSSPTPCLSGTFRLVDKDLKHEDRVQIEGDSIGDVDWILMDLLIKDEMGRRRITGFDALARFMERSPETPAVLLTWSEEPDVAAEAMHKSNAVSVVPKRRILRTPYEMRRYMNDEVGPILDLLDKDDLQKRMLKAFRLWTSYPGVLWHGEKTFHAAEHTLEHSLGLWRISNQLLSQSWDRVSRAKPDQYKPELLFRFLMSIWLHDIGHKGNETYQTAHEVRNRHAWLSGELVHRNPEMYGLSRGDEAEFISLLCAYHQSNTPFRHGKSPKDPVRGLFQRSLEDIENDSIQRDPAWQLMGWAALLRLLDAVELHWRRVGDAKLLEAKKVSIEMDLQYYAERSRDSAEARDYAKWLGDQAFHMEKHRSVLDVEIKVMHPPDASSVVFWPVYTFTSHESACEFLPEIGRDVLKEWFDERSTTGEILRDRMALDLLNNRDYQKYGGSLALPNTDDSCRYAVWIPSEEVLVELRDLIKKIDHAEKIEGNEGEVLKLKKDRDKLVRRIWMPDHECCFCKPINKENKQ